MYRNKERLYAYFAGAIDTDGFISIQKTIKKNKSLVPHNYYSAKIGLTSTKNARVLDLLKENFGGSIYTYHPRNPCHHDWSVWRTSDQRARQILKVLQPYMIAKKPQAEMVIDFLDICEAQWQQIQRTQKRPYRIPPEMLALREHYWEKVALLNSNQVATGAGVIPESQSSSVQGSKGVGQYGTFAIAPAIGIGMREMLTGFLSIDFSFLLASL